jgi:dCMP deaminase
MSRIGWDEYAMVLAEAASLRSEDPFVAVGAAAFDKNNRVLGVAYNGLAPGKVVNDVFWADRDGRRPYILHAETNLLSIFKRGEGHTIACTLLPCSCCARQIIAHDIKKVLYRDVYTKDMGALDIFKFYDIEVKRIQLPTRILQTTLDRNEHTDTN